MSQTNYPHMGLRTATETMLLEQNRQRPVSSQLSRIEQADGVLLAAVHALEEQGKDSDSLIARGLGAIADRIEKIEAKLESTITTYSIFIRALDELKKARKPLKTNQLSSKPAKKRSKR